MTDCFLSIAYDTFENEFTLDKSYILAATFRVSEEIFNSKNTGTNNIETFLKELNNEFPNVKSYINEMQTEIRQRPYMLFNNYAELINK